MTVKHTPFDEWYNSTGIYKEYANDWMDPNTLTYLLKQAWDNGREYGHNYGWVDDMEEGLERLGKLLNGED